MRGRGKGQRRQRDPCSGRLRHDGAVPCFAQCCKVAVGEQLHRLGVCCDRQREHPARHGFAKTVRVPACIGQYLLQLLPPLDIRRFAAVAKHAFFIRRLSHPFKQRKGRERGADAVHLPAVQIPRVRRHPLHTAVLQRLPVGQRNVLPLRKKTLQRRAALHREAPLLVVQRKGQRRRRQREGKRRGRVLLGQFDDLIVSERIAHAIPQFVQPRTGVRRAHPVEAYFQRVHILQQELPAVIRLQRVRYNECVRKRAGRIGPHRDLRGHAVPKIQRQACHGMHRTKRHAYHRRRCKNAVRAAQRRAHKALRRKFRAALRQQPLRAVQPHAVPLKGCITHAHRAFSAIQHRSVRVPCARRYRYRGVPRCAGIKDAELQPYISLVAHLPAHRVPVCSRYWIHPSASFYTWIRFALTSRQNEGRIV